MNKKAFHPNWHRPGRWGGERSGVASGQVEATKYVEFRNIAASFFSWYVGDFHEKHQISLVQVRYVTTSLTV
jgi:hypothetical protein